MTAARLPLPETVDCTTPLATVTVRDVVVATAAPESVTVYTAPPTAPAAAAAKTAMKTGRPRGSTILREGQGVGDDAHATERHVGA